MDVGLPDMDGREAVKLLRKGGYKGPILMLTGHDSEADTVLGLDSGANDYITKPFKFAVLLARIRAHLRQHEASEDAVFAIGPYTFKPGSKLMLTEKGSKLRLTEKETAILRFLYRAGQRVGVARCAAARGLGLQCQCDHAYARDAYLQTSPENRERAGNAKILVTEPGGIGSRPEAFTPWQGSGRAMSVRPAIDSRAGTGASETMATSIHLSEEMQLLEAIPVFELFEREALQIIAFSSDVRAMRAGDVLFRRGEISDCGYLILSGSVAFEADAARGAAARFERGALLSRLSGAFRTDRTAGHRHHAGRGARHAHLAQHRPARARNLSRTAEQLRSRMAQDARETLALFGRVVSVLNRDLSVKSLAA